MPPRAPRIASTQKPAIIGTGSLGMLTRCRDPVRIRLDALADDLLADREALRRVEADVRGARDLRLVGGRDHPRVEASRDVDDGRHDALVVDDHRLEGAGHHDQLLHEMVAGHRHAAAHHQLVAGAAQADEVDALGALALRERDKLGIAGGLHDHVGQQRVVPVQRDVHVVALSVPRLTSDMTGCGVPNRTSDSSVAIIEPPQPSDRLVRRPWRSMLA